MSLKTIYLSIYHHVSSLIMVFAEEYILYKSENQILPLSN